MQWVIGQRENRLPHLHRELNVFIAEKNEQFIFASEARDGIFFFHSKNNLVINIVLRKVSIPFFHCELVQKLTDVQLRSNLPSQTFHVYRHFYDGNLILKLLRRPKRQPWTLCNWNMYLYNNKSINLDENFTFSCRFSSRKEIVFYVSLTFSYFRLAFFYGFEFLNSFLEF